MSCMPCRHVYLPEQVRGGIGDALIRRCDGGDVGKNNSQLSLVGHGWAFFCFVSPPWLLWMVFLLFPLYANGGRRLGVNDIPSDRVREPSGLSPCPHVMCGGCSRCR